MKLVRNIGDKAIVLISNDLKNELDMDAVTSIDHSNLYGEIATSSVLLNKVGLLRAQAESEYEAAKLEFSVHKAQLSTEIRRESIVNAGKVKVEDIGLVKLTESSLEDILIINPELNAMQKTLVKKKKYLAEIDSLYWALQSKDRKLNNLVPKVTPEEFLDNLVEGEINTFIIKKEK